MKNLVMGAAKGYGWDVLEPFVTSFKRHCPNAELVLFVDDISAFTRDKLNCAGVELEDFPAELSGGVPNNVRWKIFADYLDAHGDAYEQVMTADTRDVIFQGDVFAAFSDCTRWLGCATEADLIGGNKTGNVNNRNWLVDCFGEAETARLVNKKIICDGTVIGSAAEMKIFCRVLWEAVSQIMERVNFRIHDQAVANYLIYNGCLPIDDLIEIDVAHGEIVTLSLVERVPVRGDKILRSDGGVPAVVHQYDRIDDLNRLVDRVYRAKNFDFDSRFDDPRSSVEQTVCLLFVDKVAEAARLFLSKFFSTADLSPYADALIKIWELTSAKALTQAVEILEPATQIALCTVKHFSDAQLTKLYDLLAATVKSGRTVDPTLKNILVNHWRNSLEQN